MEKATKEARIVAIPHNYLYDSYWMDRYNLNEGILIVDEAHNFLKDAAKNPYLIIGKRTKNSRPDDRQSNSYFLGDMISNFLGVYDAQKRKKESLINLESLELHDAVLYMQCLYQELSDQVRTQFNDRNKISYENA